MADLLVATATTNTTQGSVVQVVVEDLICTLTIVNNAFGDALPIIPTASRTENNKVLYQLKIKARLTQHADGRTMPNHRLAVTSSRGQDRIISSGTTDANGELLLTLESRESGKLELKTSTSGVTLAHFELTLKAAWYQSTFLITGYNVCDEDDFTGALVDGSGLNEKHKEDFLYSAAGVPMQGTGKATGGAYIRLKSMAGGWHNNTAGHPDRVSDQASVTFAYADTVMGKYNLVTENHSMAVDANVIPKKAKVNIDGVGDRYADDKGSGIHTYHIDNFLGAGKAVVTTWAHGGINGTQRKVKYLGDGT